MIKKHLWAPWRMEYIKRVKKPATNSCVFCRLLSQKNDRENLIVHRGKDVFVILNRFPYNAGHLMVVPNEHVADLTKLSEKVASELICMTQETVTALKKAYGSEGFNIGMNLGQAGGAGIRHHLHMHIVPRWIGDTNFMPVIAETKAIPQHLLTTYDKIKEQFRRT